MIETEQLAVGYARAVLEAGNLRLVPGELCAIVGPNGAGKSALLRTISGQLRTCSGSVAVDGADVHQVGAAQRARTLAFLPAADATAESVTVLDAVMQGRTAHAPWWTLGKRPSDAHCAREALALVGLAAKASSVTGALSAGELQLVWLAMAIAQGAPTMLLDEPTSHLDVRNAAAMLEILVRLAADRTIVVVLHDLSLAATYAQRIIVVGDGRIVADGAPRAALASDVLRIAYGAALRIRFEDDGTVLVGAVRGAARG